MIMIVLTCANAADQSSFSVWHVQSDGRDDSSTVEAKVRVDHAGLVAALAPAGSEDSVALSFEIPTEVLECKVGPSQLMAPELQAKYPQIKVFVGQCSNEGSAILVVDEYEENSLSTTLYNSRGEVFYVDHKSEDTADPQMYTLVNKKDIRPPEGASWNDRVVHRRRQLALAHARRREDFAARAPHGTPVSPRHQVSHRRCNYCRVLTRVR